ncbi:MAG TPA: PRC-barrel domain-containing protein [Terriglobales bacterium]|nr:PRC-barrel domain-containing protein [Terriglobales bacterium]
MAHYGTLQDYTFAENASDVRGSELCGSQHEKLGKIDDVIFDHADGAVKYVVVDTGGWLHSRKFIVPAEMIHPCAKHKGQFAADLSRQRIESFPAYDEKAVGSDEAWQRYEKQYREHWTSQGSVGHQVGSDHNITPTAAEMPAGGGAGSLGAGISAADLTPRRITSPTKLPGGPTTMPHLEEETATSHAVLPEHERTSPKHISAGGSVGEEERWSGFQSSIRSSLPDLRKRCNTCGCAGTDLQRKAS